MAKQLYDCVEKSIVVVFVEVDLRFKLKSVVAVSGRIIIRTQLLADRSVAKNESAVVVCHSLSFLAQSIALRLEQARWRDLADASVLLKFRFLVLNFDQVDTVIED